MSFIYKFFRKRPLKIVITLAIGFVILHKLGLFDKIFGPILAWVTKTADVASTKIKEYVA